MKRSLARRPSAPREARLERRAGSNVQICSYRVQTPDYYLRLDLVPYTEVIRGSTAAART